MGRTAKSGVDYFSHDTGAHNRKTISALRSRFGNDGYAFWFILLELLGEQQNLSLDCSDEINLIYLCTETQVSEKTAAEILDLLSRMEAIDRELWQKHRVIWCQGFADRLKDVYRRRSCKAPTKPVFLDENTKNPISQTVDNSNSKQTAEEFPKISAEKKGISDAEITPNSIKKTLFGNGNEDGQNFSAEKTYISAEKIPIFAAESTQSKVKESKVKGNTINILTTDRSTELVENVDNLKQDAETYNQNPTCNNSTGPADLNADLNQAAKISIGPADKVARCVSYYQNIIHPFCNTTEFEAVKQLAEEYPEMDFKLATDKAKENGVNHTRAWKYIAAILDTGGVKKFASANRKSKQNDVIATTAEALKILERGDLIDL